MTKRVWMVAALAASLLMFPAAGYAEDRGDDFERGDPTDVRLYEISERVTFDPGNVEGQLVILRHAKSPLQGFAKIGTPLCPSELLVTVPTIQSCTVIATGEDNVFVEDIIRGPSGVSFVPCTASQPDCGKGPVSGTFDVVINAPGNSKVHVPNLPVIAGTFTGMVDLSPAVVSGVPLGSIAGTFALTHMADPATGMLVPLPQQVVLPFTGRFRMPFGISAHGRLERSERKQRAFYLADDLTTTIPVKPNERSTGFPTVRLEVLFGQ